jgi:hypothetical protein
MYEKLFGPLQPPRFCKGGGREGLKVQCTLVRLLHVLVLAAVRASVCC